VNVYDGRYGPYVKHGKTNASVPKEVTVEDVTLEQALEWLAAKASSGSKSKTKSKTTGTTTKTTGTTKRSSTRKKTTK
jgi:DNA topoisomerase-1